MGCQETEQISLYPRLRLCVYRSTKHIQAQIIDDVRGFTICSASSMKLDKTLHVESGLTRKVYIAGEVGREIAEKAISKGITKVFFDRNGYKYHGRVKQLAEAARQRGLDF
ncbi:MAG: 50S ribosomal protein L18 [Acidobacteriota bacterium]